MLPPVQRFTLNYLYNRYSLQSLITISLNKIIDKFNDFTYVGMVKQIYSSDLSFDILKFSLELSKE